jgi:hypothetical protein
MASVPKQPNTVAITSEKGKELVVRVQAHLSHRRNRNRILGFGPQNICDSDTGKNSS